MIEGINACITNQCRRKACRNADNPSMISRMATVSPAKAEKIMERPKNPPPLREDKPRCITIDHRTSDNSTCNRNNKIRVHISMFLFPKSYNLFETPFHSLPVDFSPCILKLTCMSQAEGPESQVRSCIRDASKTVLNGVDGLVDCYIAKVKLWENKMHDYIDIVLHLLYYYQMSDNKMIISSVFAVGSHVHSLCHWGLHSWARNLKSQTILNPVAATRLISFLPTNENADKKIEWREKTKKE